MRKIMFNIAALLLVAYSQITSAATGLFFDVTTIGNTITITTTIPNHTYPQAGIKITAAGYSLANPGTECTVDNNGYCIFSVSDTAPATLTVNGERGSVTAILCLNGIGALSCQKYTISTFRPEARYAFVTNGANNRVYNCPVLDSGLFGACVDSGAGAIFSAPERIVLNAAGTLAYVTNFSSNTVTRCAVSAAGVLSSCTDSGVSTAFNNPVGITINSGGHIAYVSNSGDDTVFRCAINSAGEFLACVPSGNSGAIFINPWGLTLNTQGSFAYVANDGATEADSSISVCPIDNILGAFGNCQYSAKTGPGGVNGPRGIVLNNANTMGYITNGSNNRVSVCPILSSGLFSTCVDSGVGAIFNEPEELALNMTGTLAYIPNFSNNTVSICSIAATTGLFTSCVGSGNTGLGFSDPLAVTLVY